MTKAPKRPRDTNQLAKLVVDILTGEGWQLRSLSRDVLCSPDSLVDLFGELIGGLG